MTNLNVIDLHHQAPDDEAPSGGLPAGICASEQAPEVRLEDCERTRCEVWTRVMGYHRPVSAFNAGKRSEHRERQYFSECPTAAAERMLERAA